MLQCSHCKTEQVTDEGEPIKGICPKCGNDDWETDEWDLYCDLNHWFYKITYMESLDEK